VSSFVLSKESAGNNVKLKLEQRMLEFF
jgi:hypothetical protein